MKRILFGILMLAAQPLAASAQQNTAQQNVVNVYNWSDYIGTGVLDDFTKETGIRVDYDTYDSSDELAAKLVSGKTGYDVVVPSAPQLMRQIGAGVFLKLDKTKLPNSSGLWPEIAQRMAVYDPGNQYAVNYMWFTSGIAYNVAAARQRMGDTPMNSWDIVFNPQNLEKFADCGVYFLDSPADVFGAALKYLHLDPNSKNPADIHKAADMLIKVRPYIKKFDASEYIGALASGDICLAIGWSGDSFQARDRAREAGNGVDINYVIPKEGALMSLDTLAIPRDAGHVAAAFQFINFLMRPDIAARDTAATNFANGVSASKPFVDKSLLDNPSIYPDDATMKNLFVVTPYDVATQKTVAREWTRVTMSQ